MNQVAVIERHKPMLLDFMADKYGLQPDEFARTVRKTCGLKDASQEEFAAFIMVAREYDLNPLLREIFAFPKKGGGIQPIVSVDGWANLVNSQPQCDGIEFEDHFDEHGNLNAITCRIYRKDRSRPTTATEYMVECKRNTDTWQQWPRRMLRHKALIQAARYAFGLSGIVDPDEWERSPERSVTSAASPPSPPSPPPAPKIPQPTPANTGGSDVAVSDGEGEPKASGNATEAAPTEAKADDVGVAQDDDYEAMIDSAMGAFEEAETVDQISAAWNENVEPFRKTIFPPDFQAIEEAYQARLETIEAADAAFKAAGGENLASG